MNHNNKKKYLLVLGPLLLVIALIGVTYAFFNYTRTGTTNSIKVGRIYFNHTQGNTINLTNVFPTDSNHLDNTNSATVTINIEGDTEYTEGIEYKVSLVEVNNVVNGKEVPVSFNVTVSGLGTKSSDYYNDRGSTTNVYNLRENGIAENDKDILIGYIKSDNVGVNGSINVTAYIDKDEIGISDTVSRIENNNLVYGETDAEWIAGRTILTTDEWNSLTGNNALSFKIKVEANEGIWINEPKLLVMKNLHLANDSNWINIRGNVTSVEFDTEIPNNPITSFDATDLTSEGPVTVYIVDDGLGNNTVKAIICAEDVIYAPEDSTGLFRNMSKLVTFDSTNFKVDNVKMMSSMFRDCTSLTNVDGLINWNTSNLENMYYMFFQCTHLTNVNGLINWNTSNVKTMHNMFGRCTYLTNVNGLINWDTSSVENMISMFGECTSLINTDGLIKWNTASVKTMQSMFRNCSNLTIVDLSSWVMSSENFTKAMFESAGFTTIIMPNNYTRIDDFMFNHNTSYNGDSFTIPRTVTTVGNSHVFYDFGKDGIFNKFIVESGSTSLKTIDDVLYTYDGKRLISIPRGKTFANRIYEMPEGVTFMNELSFSRNQNIDTVVLPNSYVIERYIKSNNNNYGFKNSGNSLSVAIFRYTSIKEYKVKDDNTRYMSYEGCIYSKDGTELIAVPFHYNGVLNIKEGTTTIGQEAFWYFESIGNDLITAINIPASVTTIEANQLSTLNTLMSRSTNPVTITIDSGNTAYQISGNKIVAK